MPIKLTNEIVDAAILGFEEQKRHIDAKIAELRTSLSGPAAQIDSTPETPRRKRRKMSAAARARISEAQRKRWADSKKQSQPSTPAAAPKPKRKLSAAGRRAIIAATKARWARVRAESARAAKTKQPGAAKKKASSKTPAKAARKKTAMKKRPAASTPAVIEAAGQ